jgi:cytochrome P450
MLTPPRFRFTPRRLLGVFDRTRSPATWDEIGEQARDTGALWFRFLGDNTWVVTDPAWCRQVLAAPYDVVARSGTFRKIGVFLGRSLLTTDGPEHRLRRRQMQPAFHRDRLRVYADSIVAAAQDTAKTWQDGKPVAMEQEMAALTMDAIGRAVLGIDGRAAAPAVGAALERMMRALPLMFVPKFELVALRRLPGLGWLRQAFATLDGVARDAAERSEAELVASLRAAAQDVPELSNDEVRDELLTLLLAGHETTATTLTWTWWLLDRHPQVAQRLRAEVCAAIGDRVPSYDDVERLAYTQAVVAETLRLRPAAWIVERNVVGELQLGPYQPPVGSLLLIPTWLLHRDPRWWDDPEAFRPERWLDADGRYDENAPGQPRGAYLPFGAGAHVCIGASFAWTEAILALAVLAPRWEPTLAADADVVMRAAITLRPAHGMPMLLRRPGPGARAPSAPPPT